VVLREKYTTTVATVTVYTVRYRMEREGLIPKVKGDNTMYRVTERGLEQLNKAIEFMKGVVRSLEGSRQLPRD
jgi:DNA-binding PadR family transcriptional regulator